MKVAVVVLSCDHWKTSKKFLDAFSKYTDLEKVKLVWIDNGSTDLTPVNLEEYKNKGIIYNLILQEDNLGVIGGRNVGFDWFLNEDDSFDCDALMFIDNDQYVKSGWLEHHMSVLERGYDLVGVEAWQMSNNFLPISRITTLQRSFAYVGCGGMMMTRETAEFLGKFDERFGVCFFEDPDVCFRAHKNNFKIGWNAKAKILHESHTTLGGSVQRRNEFIASLNEFRKKWKGHKKPNLRQRNLPEFK